MPSSRKNDNGKSDITVGDGEWVPVNSVVLSPAISAVSGLSGTSGGGGSGNNNNETPRSRSSQMSTDNFIDSFGGDADAAEIAYDRCCYGEAPGAADSDDEDQPAHFDSLREVVLDRLMHH